MAWFGSGIALVLLMTMIDGFLPFLRLESLYDPWGGSAYCIVAVISLSGTIVDGLRRGEVRRDEPRLGG